MGSFLQIALKFVRKSKNTEKYGNFDLGRAFYKSARTAQMLHHCVWLEKSSRMHTHMVWFAEVFIFENRIEICKKFEKYEILTLGELFPNHIIYQPNLAYICNLAC